MAAPKRKARPSQQPAAGSPPLAQPQAPTVTHNPAGSPATVPGGAAVKPPKPVSGVKPHHFIPQATQTVGKNPNPPATHSASVPAEDAPPRSATSPTGFSPYFSTY